MSSSCAPHQLPPAPQPRSSNPLTPPRPRAGRGTLGQLGIGSPSMPLTIGLCSLTLMAVVIGSGATAVKLSQKKLTSR